MWCSVCGLSRLPIRTFTSLRARFGCGSKRLRVPISDHLKLGLFHLIALIRTGCLGHLNRHVLGHLQKLKGFGELESGEAVLAKAQV